MKEENVIELINRGAKINDLEAQGGTALTFALNYLEESSIKRSIVKTLLLGLEKEKISFEEENEDQKFHLKGVRKKDGFSTKALLENYVGGLDPLKVDDSEIADLKSLANRLISNLQKPSASFQNPQAEKVQQAVVCSRN